MCPRLVLHRELLLEVYLQGQAPVSFDRPAQHVRRCFIIYIACVFRIRHLIGSRYARRRSCGSRTAAVTAVRRGTVCAFRLVIVLYRICGIGVGFPLCYVGCIFRYLFRNLRRPSCKRISCIPSYLRSGRCVYPVIQAPYLRLQKSSLASRLIRHRVLELEVYLQHCASVCRYFRRPVRTVSLALIQHVMAVFSGCCFLVICCYFGRLTGLLIPSRFRSAVILELTRLRVLVIILHYILVRRCRIVYVNYIFAIISSNNTLLWVHRHILITRYASYVVIPWNCHPIPCIHYFRVSQRFSLRIVFHKIIHSACLRFCLKHSFQFNIFIRHFKCVIAAYFDPFCYRLPSVKLITVICCNIRGDIIVIHYCDVIICKILLGICIFSRAIFTCDILNRMLKIKINMISNFIAVF